MADFSSQHVATSKRLFLSMSAAALILEKELSRLFVSMGLGRGFFRRGMSNQLKTQTNFGIWAYLSALIVCMVETWPSRPPASDLDLIIQILEGSLIEAQRIDYRQEYEEYRQRFRSGRSRTGVPDGKIFGPIFGLYSEFHLRLVLTWGVPSRATCSPYASDETFERADQTSHAFTSAMGELNRNIEEGFRNALQELWPIPE